MDSSTSVDVVALVKSGVESAFDIAGSAFDFLMNNPLCSLMVGLGFAFTALNLIRKGLKVAKRT